jgi:hypothetical protein
MDIGKDVGGWADKSRLDLISARMDTVHEWKYHSEPHEYMQSIHINQKLKKKDYKNKSNVKQMNQRSSQWHNSSNFSSDSKTEIALYISRGIINILR